MDLKKWYQYMKKLSLQFKVIILAVTGFLGNIYWHLSGDKRIDITIYITDGLNIILSVTGFLVVITHLKYRKNIKVNFMAISYGILSILIIFKMYLFKEVQVKENLVLCMAECEWLLSMLQLIWLYIMTNHINEKWGERRWIKCIVSIFVVGIIILFTNYYIYKDATIQDIIHFNYYYSCTLIICFMLIIRKCIKERHRMPILEKEYITGSIIVQVLYQLITLIWKNTYYGGTAVILHILVSLNFIITFKFIYTSTREVVWKGTGDGLLNRQKQLKENEIEKGWLVLASYALKQHVCHMNHAASKIHKKITKGESTKIETYIDKIINNCHRLTKLTGNLFDLGKIDIGTMTSESRVVNLNRLVEMIIESIFPYTDIKKINVIFTQPLSPVFCYIDYDAMERVILNLLSNAIKYNHEGGTIKVHVNGRNGQAYLCVEDTGIGIPKQKVDKIFNRFERVEEGLAKAQEGSGLGLALVKSIVEIHHGKVYVVSEEYKGTLIGIELPLYVGQIEKEYVVNSHKKLKRKIQVEFSDISI